MWERLHVRKRDDVSVVISQQSRASEIQPDFARKVLRLKLLHTTIPASFKALEKAVNSGAPSEATDPAFKRAVGKLLTELGVLKRSSAQPAPTPPEMPDKAPKKRAKKKPSGRRERGQASVEFVGMLPVIALLAAFLFESLFVGMAIMTASHGANEGARSAAVGNPPDKVEKDVKSHMMETWAKQAEVEYDEGDDEVTVRVPIPMLVPALGSPWHMETSAKVVHEG